MILHIIKIGKFNNIKFLDKLYDLYILFNKNNFSMYQNDFTVAILHLKLFVYNKINKFLGYHFNFKIYLQDLILMKFILIAL